MDAVARAAAIYFLLLAVLRFAGRRTLSDMTSFDLVLLLIIGEATQQALLGDDFSLVNAVVVIVTLIALDIGMSLLQNRFPGFEKLVNGVPMILVENGRPLRERMRRARVDVDNVLESARRTRGLERLDQIRFAILETDGSISIIPASPSDSGPRGGDGG